MAKELERELGPNGPQAADLVLLREQVQRCRGILAKLKSIGEAGDEHFEQMSLAQLIEEVVEPHRDFGIAIAVDLGGEGGEPIGRRNPGLLYGLGNIVENAVDFARSRVEISAHWDRAEVVIEIVDDGPGIPDEVLGKLGEPYVTTRGRDVRRGVVGEYNVGLGLGFFIAKTLIERSGARLTVRNRLTPESGARLRMVWPLSAMSGADRRAPAANAPAA